ncbi:unnamed protein product [Effrenium voratum]|nr:unnamed protein product [Effrenium voratum]
MKATLLVLISAWAANASDIAESQPLASMARRLQLSFNSTCLSLCPGLGTFTTDLVNFSMQMSNAGDNTLDMMGGMFDVLCSHQPAMTCMSTQCDTPAELGPMLPMMGCICTDCPSFKNVYSNLASVMTTMLSSMTGGAANVTAVMEAICPIVGPMECVSSSSVCSEALSQQGGTVAFTGMTAMKDNCTASGYSTGTNDLATTTTMAEVSAALAVPGFAGIVGIAGMLIVF